MKNLKLIVIIVLFSSIAALSIHYFFENENNNLSDANQEIVLNEYGYIPLEDLPDDYTVERAVEDGIINVQNGGIDNKENFEEFFLNVKNNTDSMIRTLQYTTEGDSVYTDIIFHSKGLDSPYFEYHERNNAPIMFKYIVTDNKEIHLSSDKLKTQSDDVAICYTALGIDNNIWDNAIPIIKDIMKVDTH